MRDIHPSVLVETLKHVQKRPAMYVSADVPPMVSFLSGFELASRMLLRDADYDRTLNAIIQQRGWKVSTVPLWDQMAERGMDAAAVVDELLSIHIAVWEALTRHDVIAESK